jgi:hypothetical protein
MHHHLFRMFGCFGCLLGAIVYLFIVPIIIYAKVKEMVNQ